MAKNNKNESRTPILLELTEEDKEKFKEISKEFRVSRTTLARLALIDYCNHPTELTLKPVQEGSLSSKIAVPVTETDKERFKQAAEIIGIPVKVFYSLVVENFIQNPHELKIK